MELRANLKVALDYVIELQDRDEIEAVLKLLWSGHDLVEQEREALDLMSKLESKSKIINGG